MKRSNVVLLRQLEQAYSKDNVPGVSLLVADLRHHRNSPATAEGALARALMARQYTFLGDFAAARDVLAPYLIEVEGRLGPNEDAIAQVLSPTTRAALLLRVGLVLADKRDYEPAAEFVRKAIAIYEENEKYHAKALAYYWLSVIQFHQQNYLEAETCSSKSIELSYLEATRIKNTQQDQLSLMIARNRIWLGVLAQCQGQLAKAKAELYTARGLLQGAFGGEKKKRDPRAWGDLYAVLGKVYCSEGQYDLAIQEVTKALDCYTNSGHVTYKIQTRIHLARICIKQFFAGSCDPGCLEKANSQLKLAAVELGSEIPGDELRTACLLVLTNSWLHYALKDWSASENLADSAIRLAMRLGSHFLLAQSYRAKADAEIQLRNLQEARKNLKIAAENAQSLSAYKTVGAILLSLARSYCSSLEPNQVEVDKYLDRFADLKAEHLFESHYLEELHQKIKQDRSELPSAHTFYFSVDELASSGFDAGMAKFLLWGIRAAHSGAHGDVKEMTRLLHFNNLTRTYKYIKLARKIEHGDKSAVKRLSKVQTLRD